MLDAEQPLDPIEYSFWTPESGHSLATGGDGQQVPLPQIPLPLHRGDLEKGETPDDKAIGSGLYDYLRRFPDCPRNREYAQLLKGAYSFYIADLGSQIIMLEAKDVDAPSIRRKISYLKILALLEPENPGLLLRLGIACYELALVYTELIHIRRELMNAVSWLQRSLQQNDRDLTTLNYLGQASYLLGDYPAVRRYWQGVVDQLPDSEARTTLQERLARIAAGQIPARPLADDFEGIGIAMEHYSLAEYQEAKLIMDRLEEEGRLPEEMPSPEFYYFLGLCREKGADSAGAFQAFTDALQIDPAHEAAQQGLERILDGKEAR